MKKNTIKKNHSQFHYSEMVTRINVPDPDFPTWAPIYVTFYINKILECRTGQTASLLTLCVRFLGCGNKVAGTGGHG